MTPVVFDTVTLFQAAVSPTGPAGACLNLVMEGKLTLFLSIDGLHELHEVLSRGKTRRHFPLLDDDGIEQYLDSLRAEARIEPQVPAVVRYARDPDDEHILNLVIAVQAHFLVTHDKDLLDLMKTDDPDGTALRRHWPALQILDPVAFLRVEGIASA